MEKALLIVESPAKARTISKYLGSGFIVESSIGHVRDLPSTAAEIPKKHKGEAWARLGVNVEDEFVPLYIVPASKKGQVKKLRDLLAGASALYLATDTDREGEAIAWHLMEVLKPKCPVRRMTFDEITKQAIVNAVEQTRDIDRKLVNAQETRRILDRLFGYEVSPVLWRKVKPKLSAGRVQSVATRLVVERERARMRFVTAEYWDIEARLKPCDGQETVVDARLVELGGKRVARGKDFDSTTGRLKNGSDVAVLGGEEARALVETLRTAPFAVSDVTEKPFTRQPSPPFITSTLQQEAGRKLRYTAQRTMRLAQGLYENGYITYMRTDSTQLSNQAINAARSQAADLYGTDAVPDSPRFYKSRSKNAQEAHEAIRPAGETFRTPASLGGALDRDALRLYELIWKRTVACQMKDARGLRTQVRIRSDAGERGDAIFSASGMVITYPGFLRAYVEGSDDPQGGLAEKERILPQLATGQPLEPDRVDAAGAIAPVRHTTQPPARYTEASLIKELEDRGIGRPSTYASIIQTIQDRGYVWHKGTALVPTFTAFAVTRLLERHMATLVDYDFTARMEDSLDAIAGGRQEPIPWLRAFYFGSSGSGDAAGGIGLKDLVRTSGETIDAREVSATPIGKAESGEEVVVRVGRYGAYVQIGDSDQRASLADDIVPDELDLAKALEIIEEAARGDRVIGADPDTGKPIYIKTGRFGPYVQLGDPELTEKGRIRKGTKPKMASLWPSMTPESISLSEAVLLLSFPREVGAHPDTGEAITAQDGRFGPYIRMGEESRSLDGHEKLASITLDEAVALFKEPKKSRRRGATSVVADLGEHPESGAAMTVKTGRYGPYVTDGAVNATIPKGKDPASITREEAVELIAAREQKLLAQGKDPRAPKKKAKKKATKKTGGKKAKKTTKKTAKKAGKKTAKKAPKKSAGRGGEDSPEIS